MERAFSRAALFAIVIMAATAGLGLWLGDLHGVTDRGVLRWATVHRLCGVFAALTVVLVNCLSVTYFIGTGRWCREVVEVYGLDRGFIARSTKLKRSTFPFALAGMLAVVAIVALGGAADPAAGRAGSRDWVTWHLVGGIGLATAIAWCFQAQRPGLRGQQDLIGDLMDEVRRERQDRGLDVEEPPGDRQ